MKAEFIIMRTTLLVLKLSRVIAAMTGEKQYQVLERLLKAELERIQNEQKQNQSTESLT
jgi:ABC-type transporter MlaC component